MCLLCIHHIREKPHLFIYTYGIGSRVSCHLLDLYSLTLKDTLPTQPIPSTPIWTQKSPKSTPIAIEIGQPN